MAKSIIVYPISGNPPTWGRTDLMKRPQKNLMKFIGWRQLILTRALIFSMEERLEMMEAYLKYYKLKNVTLAGEGAVIRYAESVNAQFLLRGLRNTTDFQMELELAAGNRGINKQIETVCLFTKPHYATISSTLVRELAMLGEQIDQYVLPEISEKIIKKLGQEGSRK